MYTNQNPSVCLPRHNPYDRGTFDKVVFLYHDLESVQYPYRNISIYAPDQFSVVTNDISSYQNRHLSNGSFSIDEDSMLNHNLPFRDLLISIKAHNQPWKIWFDQTLEHHHPVSLLQTDQVGEVDNGLY